MNAAAAAADDAQSLSKETEGLREDVFRIIAGLPKPASAPPNVVGTHFTVQMNAPLPYLNTTLATAYGAQDARNPGTPLYALVCDPKMPVRGKVIKALLNVSIPNLVTLHACGLADLTGIPGRRMVLVYDRPAGKSLEALLAERTKMLPEQYVADKVVTPIGNIIQQFAELEISHGRICPQNVFMSDTGVVLGECASEPCGYSQPYAFEPPDRAQALPAGKGESTPANDTFSLGVLAAFLQLGPRLFSKGPTQEEHIIRLLRDGSYVALAANIDFSDGMTDLLRGTLPDRPAERWTWQQLKPWCKGRRYNMLPPAAPSAATRPYPIDKVEYYTPRELSHGLHKNWDAAVRGVLDGSLLRWLDLSVRRKDIGDIVRRTMQALGVEKGLRTPQQKDELTARVITILDPQAPLSLKEVRVHPSGVGALIAEGFRIGDRQLVQSCLDVIEQGLGATWADMHKRKDEEISTDIQNCLWLLDRMRMVVRMPGFGFGLERAIYDLNPDLACQSPILGDNHAHTVKDLLMALDRLAPEKARETPPFDVHIAAFLGSKLTTSRESHLSEYGSIPKLAKHKSFVTLRLLEQAHDSCGRPRLPGLSAWVTAELMQPIEEFHSRGVREQMQTGLKQLADNGYLTPIYQFINQRGFAASNLDGYREAIETYFKMSKEIATLRDKRIQKGKASISGFAVAKYIANMALVAVAFYVFKEKLLR